MLRTWNRSSAGNLVRTLLNPNNRYGLSFAERRLLQAHQFHGVPSEDVSLPRGAEGGGVLLDQRDPDTVVGVKLDEERNIGRSGPNSKENGFT